MVDIIMTKTEGAECAYTGYDPTPAPPPPARKPPVARSRAYEEQLKPAVAMSGDIRGPTRDPPGPLLKPALASIKDSCAYMGGISRAAFYATVLPQLDTVKLSKRNFVVVASMDRLIEASLLPAE